MNVGIDVSKSSLDVVIRPTGSSFKVTNDEKGAADLAKRLSKLTVERIIIEPTGGYEATLLQALLAAKLPVIVINARQIRDFAKASGRLAKTDAIDADLLAHFGEAMRPEIREIPSEMQRQLEALVSRRRQLVDMRSAEMKRKETAPAVVQPSIDIVIEFLTKQIDDADNDIHKLIEKCPAWHASDALLRSMPGVGAVTAATLTALVPELGKLNRKQMAALIGVAPLNNDSGKRKGKRTTWGGRSAVRAVLYMAALSARRYNPVFSDFYDRLIKNGKIAKVAIVAVMRKLLTTLNAMARDGKAWSVPALSAGG